MDEKTLRRIYEKFQTQNRNVYSENISVNLIDITKRELERLGIKYKTVDYRGKERLDLYDGDEFLYRYNRSFYHNNSKLGFKIANDKLLTERFMKYNNIATTNSRLFSENDFDKAYKYVLERSRPMVVKPLNLMGGLGVHLNVTALNFEYAWNQCRSIQKDKKVEEPRMIVQEQVSGFEVRINITEGKIYSSTLRVPSHVKGDGNRTIKELINLKNAARKKDPFLKNKLIKINSHLENILNQKGRSLEYVLANEELCVLYPQSNMVQGGENYEVTNLLNRNVLEQARNAVLALPGLHTAGIDIMIDDFSDELGTVIEVNKAPEFLMTYYPIIGEPRNPLYSIFNSFFIESRVLRDKISASNVSSDDLEVIKERYRFLYEKQKSQENSIRSLLEENEELKNKLDQFGNVDEL
ncbi:hypothetical protein FO441_00995 [Salinicoccus cyprini]|uniref:ATP-grasp domain-containing protein n=1 Tax=Salinicoccus cyprini TaxID=2493691 RepID=A0A558AXB1_9STAP|nr:hypothetical protein [Salinicoccus cyprini]TVT28888.1 hypothetical protein FO441_00995 [Salinicoccus cyprini]